MSMIVNYTVDRGSSEHGHKFLDLTTGHKATVQRAGCSHLSSVKEKNARANCVYTGQFSGSLNGQTSFSGLWFGEIKEPEL
ncbi:hypothetical protein IJT93_07745 [bacterium]|nr:hypothetical protein [bacterium]